MSNSVAADGRCYLYRCYDNGGAVLYIGVSETPHQRCRQHQRLSAWFGQVQRTDGEEFPSRSDALEAEKQAIIAKLPVYNRLHNPLIPSDAGRKPVPPADKLSEPVSVRLRPETLGLLDAISASTLGNPTRPQLLREAVEFYLDSVAPFPSQEERAR